MQKVKTVKTGYKVPVTDDKDRCQQMVDVPHTVSGNIVWRKEQCRAKRGECFAHDKFVSTHTCKPDKTCICGVLAEEPDDKCPVHGCDNTPRCACGRFVKTQKENAENKTHESIETKRNIMEVINGC